MVTHLVLLAVVLRLAGPVHRLLRPVPVKRNKPLPKMVLQPPQRLHRLARVLLAWVTLPVVPHLVYRQVILHPQRRPLQLLVVYPATQQVFPPVVRAVGLHVPQLAYRPRQHVVTLVRTVAWQKRTKLLPVLPTLPLFLRLLLKRLKPIAQGQLKQRPGLDKAALLVALPPISVVVVQRLLQNVKHYRRLM